MPETVKMLLVLTLVAGAAGIGLAAVNDGTAAAIAENERQFTLRSIRKVVPASESPDPCQAPEPAFDNSPDEDLVCVDGLTVYRGRKGDEVVGLAIVAIGEQAYSGTITTLVGLNLEGTVTGIEVLKHAETPGLGAKIEDCAWRSQLVGKGASDMVWKVVKDGGEVDQIGGATISSRSMIDAVLKAQKLLAEKKDEILSAAPLGAGEVCDGQ
ncbi:MAG: RnfABCDGE type electron transport complex subunit G [Deltaproteobacteria bacterium]|jgi:electron transport complex protein RnfG|nr:RnfABCDGE type electron transport complex subunit G [Deltaproteobacteria bacterium]